MGQGQGSVITEEEVSSQSKGQIDAAKKLQELLIEEHKAKLVLWGIQRKIIQFWRDLRILQPIGFLTPREEQVVSLLKMRKGNKEIAAELGISERTAKFHVAGVLAKFGVRRREELW